MRLKELKEVLYSLTGSIQFAIVYDIEQNKDLESDCSIEYAIKNYGDCTVRHIGADGGSLVITI